MVKERRLSCRFWLLVLLLYLQSMTFFSGHVRAGEANTVRTEHMGSTVVIGLSTNGENPNGPNFRTEFLPKDSIYLWTSSDKPDSRSHQLRFYAVVKALNVEGFSSGISVWSQFIEIESGTTRTLATEIYENGLPLGDYVLNAIFSAQVTLNLPFSVVGEIFTPDPPRRDLLDSEAGARVVSSTSHYDAKWQPRFLIDGSVGKGWSSGEGRPYPNEIVFELDGVHELEAFVVDSTNAQEDGWPGISAKDFELHMSVTSAEIGFERVLTETAAQQTRSVFPLAAPVKARWLKLVVLSNWGDPEFTEIMELAAYGEAAPKDDGQVAGLVETEPEPGPEDATAVPKDSVDPTADSPNSNIANALEKTYPDGRGGVVKFPLGDKSFAEEVVSFQIGNPKSIDKNPQNPKNMLGEPDYEKNDDTTFVTLGCRGAIELRFQNIALVDVDGPDLHVFEIGPNVEPTNLWISKDGETWIDVGRIAGGRASIDIAPHVTQGEIFRYVKLKDLGSFCASNWPGADIDAVGAIGSVLRITLEGEVLFDFNRSDLKQTSYSALDELVEKLGEYPRATAIVVGHTDSKGSTDYNINLSLHRAEAVQAYLKESLGSRLVFEVRGAGEAEPIASNNSDEGRAKNRRVEITIFPPRVAQN